ncbi:MAG: hypothetical protein AAFY71_22665 [Bacteroidota bacterium]
MKTSPSKNVSWPLSLVGLLVILFYVAPPSLLANAASDEGSPSVQETSSSNSGKDFKKGEAIAFVAGFHLTLLVALAGIFALPVYGIIGGLAALGLLVGSFFGLRKTKRWLFKRLSHRSLSDRKKTWRNLFLVLLGLPFAGLFIGLSILNFDLGGGQASLVALSILGSIGILGLCGVRVVNRMTGKFYEKRETSGS